MSSKNTRLLDWLLNGTSFGIGSIGLLADILGIGKVAYDLIGGANLRDLGWMLILLVIAFLFGTAFALVGIKGFQNLTLERIVRFYGWVYVAMAALSYFGVMFVLNAQMYSLGQYVSFVVVIAVQLFAGTALDSLTGGVDARYRGLPILTICLIHVVIMIYTYVFARTPFSTRALGDILFFVGMSTVAVTMLGGSVLGAFSGRTQRRGPWKDT